MTDIISDLAVSPGDIMRTQRDANRRADEESTARRTERTVIRKGALRVVDGANIQVEDGGDIRLRDGGGLLIEDDGSVVLGERGAFRSTYRDSNYMSIWMGGIIDITGRPATGITTQHPSGQPYFSAYRWSDTEEAHFRAGPVSSMRLQDESTSALWIEQLGAGGVVIRAPEAAPNVWISHGTVGSGPQCTISETGLIRRVSSSANTKVDIEDITVAPENVLNLRPRTWRDRNAVEDDPDCEDWHVGFVAEEVEAAGLDEFVIYNADGEADGILYDRLTVALLELVRSQEERLSRLEERVNALDGGGTIQTQSRRVRTSDRNPKRTRRTTAVYPSPPSDDLGNTP